MTHIKVEPLTPEAFAPFGRVLAKPDTPTEAADRADLDVWFGISDLMGLENKNPIITFLECTRHDLPVNQIERHNRTPEAFIPLEGESVILVAPISDPQDPNAVPDESELRAFLLDGSAGVFLPRGAWHWAPFPIGESATFLLIFDSDILNDIEIREIGPHQIQFY